MFHQAKEKDLDGVVEIYEMIFDHEAEHICYSNWKRGLYPTRSVAKEALAAGTLYIQFEEDELVSSVILNHTQAVEYQDLPWSVSAAPEEVLVIHTLSVKPSCGGKGYGKKTLTFAEELALNLGCKTIRLDTDQGNVPAATLYGKYGYRYVGNTPFKFMDIIWDSLKCFEKSLLPLDESACE